MAITKQDLLFLKLGGSLITDKTAVESVRDNVLTRLAEEIAMARAARPDLRLVLGHGSGSFGHVAAARHQTRDGVVTAEQWMGFCEVSAAATRLNRLVCGALLEAGVPVVSIQPSASAVCSDGRLMEMSTTPIKSALDVGLTPLVYGDVAFDRVRGGTIISTEDVFSFLAMELEPKWLLLAGNTPGVFDGRGEVISRISPANFDVVSDALGRSEGTDVTGGMDSKVRGMLALLQERQGLSIRIFSGLEPGRLRRVLLDPAEPAGTLLTA